MFVWCSVIIADPLETIEAEEIKTQSQNDLFYENDLNLRTKLEKKYKKYCFKDCNTHDSVIKKWLDAYNGDQSNFVLWGYADGQVIYFIWDIF